MTITVTELYYYPIKSCRGVAVPQAVIEADGFAYDRRWMVVDLKGRFLTQRRLPAMALIEPTLDADGLRLSAPDRAPLRVSPVEQSGARTPHAARVWGFDGDADDCGDAAADWLSAFLGLPCRLVTAGSAWLRPVDSAYERFGSSVAFADGFPFLLISQASLDDLNGRLAAPVAMNRFRPNIVVDGCEPHAEDGWQRVAIGGQVFHVVEPCARCSVPNVDQNSGAPGEEPGATLATYRRRDGEVYFGQNLIHESRSGAVAVGDTLTVLD